MEEQIKNRIKEIGENFNGNHKRTIKDLQEVIDNLKEKQKQQRRTNNLKVAAMLGIVLCSLLLVNAAINYKINGTQKFSVRDNETIVTNVLRGESPLEIEEVLSFINTETGVEDYALYVGKEGENYSSVPAVFNNTLVFQTTNLTNPYDIEICFWDEQNQTMFFCINQGALARATTFRRSLQIVGNTSVKENDENFTLCEGANYVGCDTDVTGADLLVQDGIEAGGSIYANGNIVAVGNVYALDVGAAGSYINQLFATQISATTINATTTYVGLVSADTVSATNMTMTSITHMIGSYSNNEAYVCVNDAGTIYAKDSACS